MKKVAELVAEANQRVTTLRAEDLAEHHTADAKVFVDIRDTAELARDGKIPGAVHVSRGMLEFAIDPTSPYHNPVLLSGKSIVFYCASGGRSALAADTARQMGLLQLAHLGGGFKAWVAAGGPVDQLA
jgi:rhodanese-related sulfurtransferase